MKISLPTLALAFSTLATAQFNNQSAPFHLYLVSEDKTIDGDTLSTCHEGAAISSLCLSNSTTVSKTAPLPASTFTFNSSDQVVTPNATLGAPGWLTWLLVGGNFEVSEALRFSYDPASNVAHPQLFPGGDGATQLAFDTKDSLNIQGYVDDTQNPPVSGETRAYYRWYACITYYVGYQYQTVNWVLGADKPQNPSCVKVDVKRKFI
ncbi:hypothetical protein B0J11DRAFT_172058 [Dendryphion nanum]|uniref:DUF7907 domain-containing protein n=1 Tax=Dendryphion nanum TaxID=256645 RepID=A0A9P9EEU1_9PLEO|nr:hypothetical protein B0J11DRAFT_172058 [Dendryphion nanum]